MSTDEIQEKKRLYRRQYYLAHREKEKANQKESYWNDPDTCRNRSNSWKKLNKNKIKIYRKNYKENNKNKENSVRKNWRTKNPDKVKSTLLKQSYGITLEKFKALIQKQENKCGICNKPFTKKYPMIPTVDHVHDRTKRVRGVLCQKCNSALGLFKDSIPLMKIGIDWLLEKKHKTTKRKINYIIPKKYFYRIKKVFKISTDQYLFLLSENNNRCGICEHSFVNSFPYNPGIDHDHTTGVIRGLLCCRCNSALGLFEDNKIIINKGITWVKENQK